jgi:hypothetical protein
LILQTSTFADGNQGAVPHVPSARQHHSVNNIPFLQRDSGLQLFQEQLSMLKIDDEGVANDNAEDIVNNKNVIDNNSNTAVRRVSIPLHHAGIPSHRLTPKLRQPGASSIAITDSDVNDDNTNDDEDDNQTIELRSSVQKCFESIDNMMMVCDPGLMITEIRSASFGSDAGACSHVDRTQGLCTADITKEVIGQCLNREFCVVSTPNLTAACATTDRPARLAVDYECSAWKSSRFNAAEVERQCKTIVGNGSLACPHADHVITNVDFAFFGANDGSCASGLAPGVCSRNVKIDAQRFCLGKVSCDLAADVRTFGVPCANETSPASLAISYHCGLLSSIHEALPSGNGTLAGTYSKPSLGVSGNSAIAFNPTAITIGLLIVSNYI